MGVKPSYKQGGMRVFLSGDALEQRETGSLSDLSSLQFYDRTGSLKRKDININSMLN